MPTGAAYDVTGAAGSLGVAVLAGAIAEEVCLVAEAEGRPNVQAGCIAGLDTSVAHPARVYDYWLGGKDNFAADREAAERVLAAAPGLRFRVRANRAFLGRTTRYLAAEAGIRQFLDIGTGIPTGDNTHEVAQREAPDARVVYVDNDRCTSGCAHARCSLQAA